MTDREHHRRLEHLYAAAPVTRWFGTTIRIDDGTAEVRVPVRPEFLHAAGAVHGSVYFRLLDDAAFFAVNSRVTDVLVLTVTFTAHFVRPACDRGLRATGHVLHQGGRLFLAEARLVDLDDRLLALGTGTFTRSDIPLDHGVGYA